MPLLAAATVQAASMSPSLMRRLRIYRILRRKRSLTLKSEPRDATACPVCSGRSVSPYLVLCTRAINIIFARRSFHFFLLPASFSFFPFLLLSFLFLFFLSFLSPSFCFILLSLFLFSFSSFLFFP